MKKTLATLTAIAAMSFAMTASADVAKAKITTSTQSLPVGVAGSMGGMSVGMLIPLFVAVVVVADAVDGTN